MTSDWTVAALWNSLHEDVYNVVNSIICCAKEERASIVLDWLNEFKWFVLQNCEKLQNYRFNWLEQKKKIVSEVSMIKKLFTWDVMYKKYI